MPAFHRIAIIATTCVALMAFGAQAATMLALASVARAYGFTYATEGTQAAVELARPGVSLLVRAGDPRYQVNDDVRYLGRAPVFRNNDMYVDAGFERILAGLAATHPWPAPAVPIVDVPGSAPAALPPLTVAAHYVDGSEAITVSGTGPPGLPVTVALKARMSRDIPIVTIDRAIAIVGSDGRYDVVIPASSVTIANTTFIASASGRGVETVTTQIGIQKPNPNLHSPNDGLPKD